MTRRPARSISSSAAGAPLGSESATLRAPREGLGQARDSVRRGAARSPTPAATEVMVSVLGQVLLNAPLEGPRVNAIERTPVIALSGTVKVTDTLALDIGGTVTVPDAG